LSEWDSQDHEPVIPHLTANPRINSNTILFRVFDDIGRAESISTLDDGMWLDEYVIAAMSSYLLASFPQPNVFLLSTRFCQKEGMEYKSDNECFPTNLKKSPDESLENTVLYLPTFHVQHWFLTKIDFPQKSILVYNSLSGAANYEEHVNRIKLVFKEQMGVPLTFWLPTLYEDVPQQTNSNDCGVYTVLFFEYLLRGKSLESVNEITMQEYRQHIAQTLLLTTNEGQQLLYESNSVTAAIKKTQML
jgi:Ulp1 protease family, C-terminal catalytic domain